MQLAHPSGNSHQSLYQILPELLNVCHIPALGPVPNQNSYPVVL